MFANYIKETTTLLAGTSLKPCVKQPVYAMIVTLQGQELYGANWMSNEEVTVCPRVELGCKTGEGYELCKDTCNQSFHAEVSAIRGAELEGYNLLGATLYLTGHTYCCDNCIAEMKRAGLSHAICLDSGKYYSLFD